MSAKTRDLPGEHGVVVVGRHFAGCWSRQSQTRHVTSHCHVITDNTLAVITHVIHTGYTLYTLARLASDCARGGPSSSTAVQARHWLLPGWLVIGELG